MTVEVNFDGAEKYRRKVTQAVTEGAFAAATVLSDEVTRGYGSSGGGPYARKVSKRTGIPYWTGPGAPKGGYPGRRSHLLSQRTGSDRLTGGFFSRVFRGSGFDAQAYAATAYARHVHKSHPFFKLGIRAAADAMDRRFANAVRRRLSR